MHKKDPDMGHMNLILDSTFQVVSEKMGIPATCLRMINLSINKLKECFGPRMTLHYLTKITTTLSDEVEKEESYKNTLSLMIQHSGKQDEKQ